MPNVYYKKRKYGRPLLHDILTKDTSSKYATTADGPLFINLVDIKAIRSTTPLSRITRARLEGG